jgi:large subunit ribosomal protein L24
MALKIRKGDQVKVIAGKDRGKTGSVETVLPERQRIVVTGVNILKKAVKASAQTKQAGIIEFAAPIHISNVMVIDPKSGEPTRVGYKVTGQGKTRRKTRIARKSGADLTATEKSK